MLQPSCNLAACTEIWKGWKELIEILEMTDDDKYDKWWGNSERNLPWAMLTAPFTDTAPELVWKVPVPGRWQHYSRILNRSLPVGPDAQASSKPKHTTEGPGTSRSIKVATWQCEARSSCNITWDLHQARYTNQNCSRQILNICRYECGVVRECAYRNPSAVIRATYTYCLLVEVCWSYVSKTGLSLLCTIRCKVLRDSQSRAIQGNGAAACLKSSSTGRGIEVSTRKREAIGNCQGGHLQRIQVSAQTVRSGLGMSRR